MSLSRGTFQKSAAKGQCCWLRTCDPSDEAGHAVEVVHTAGVLQASRSQEPRRDVDVPQHRHHTRDCSDHLRPVAFWSIRLLLLLLLLTGSEA